MTLHDLDSSQKRLEPQRVPAAVQPLDPGHLYSENQAASAGVEPLAQSHAPCDTQMGCALVDLAQSQDPRETQPPTALCDSSDGQTRSELQRTSVVGGSSSASAHGNHENQRPGGASGLSSNHPSIEATHPQTSPAGWLELRIWAEQFEDAQKARIAAVNRAERGGVDPAVYQAYTIALTASEKVCGLHMRRCYRRVVPAEIVAWQKATLGIGEHLAARLLGNLGHPVWATPHHWEGTGSNRVLISDPPFARTVGQLWQYCGHGRPGRAAKGASATDLAALGSPKLKMIVHLLAEACMKTRTSPYRLVYEQTRLKVADKAHSVECVRCGPSGKPAQPGTPWAPGHQHAHALRVVGKELLRDLWITANTTEVAA